MGGCQTTPPDPARPTRRTPLANPCPRQPTTGSLFLAPDHRPPLAGIKLVRPRPRPEGALTLRTLQLDPGPRSGTNRQQRGKPAKQSPPARRPQQVTGPIFHALLTAKAPMGVDLSLVACQCRWSSAWRASSWARATAALTSVPPGSSGAPARRGSGEHDVRCWPLGGTGPQSRPTPSQPAVLRTGSTRGRTGIEPADDAARRPPVLKTRGATRRPDAPGVDVPAPRRLTGPPGPWAG